MEFHQLASLEAFKGGDIVLILRTKNLALETLDFYRRYPCFPTGESGVDLVDR